MQLRTIIVDDELSGREILFELLNKFCTDVEVVDRCADVESAVVSIRKHRPHLIFLDVEMPNYAGYELVDFFDEIDFQIVFVTAYDKYALKAFEVAAIDYILKPIEIEKLKGAVSKVKHAVLISNYKEQLVSLAEQLRASEHKIKYVDKGYTYHLQINDIIALEAKRAYTTIYLKENNEVTISKNLSQLEKELAEYEKFLRIHRSWLINMGAVKSYSKSQLKINLEGDITAKLSKQYKSKFDELIAS
ncbi:LytR/AlgR family response regulator transcription factor [Parvicella tangerina]|uniref:Transcriptional regulatory protein BtsR n=1 Tax=Parvicella tangerina TaxID=2829795 RepID=A0A916JP83_9FLAO|nr:LytTR family DNA-binding domain-containing protein [Parvicella tangerina]CAG5083729.1 Transcriptional regulatory protein BtsR [Parvicella tangerina]